MERDKALLIVKQQISGPRYEHTVRVLNTAIELANRYGADIKNTELAAIFHDYAKLHSINDLKRKISSKEEDPRLLAYHPELWHGPAAAQIVRDEFKINDPDILNAIRFHTTGRPNMSVLEKVIYLADYIEPGRNFPGVNDVRELAKNNLDEAILIAIGKTIQFLISKNATIFPDTFEAYNYFIFLKEEKKI